MSLRRYARMVKRAGRLITGNDVLYSYDVRPRKITLGTDYGGWTIAPEGLDGDSVVYSFGVGDDISFDLEAIRRFDCHIFGFDPTPKVAQWIGTQTLPSHYVFYNYGLGPTDGEISFFAPTAESGMFSTNNQHRHVTDMEVRLPVKSLSTIVHSLGSVRIDILKMDIEGAEYDLLPAIIDCPVPIRQLLIEFHHRIGIGTLQDTRNAVERLRGAGYQLFHVSETSSEFSFLSRAT